jgi:hypothetical protein
MSLATDKILLTLVGVIALIIYYATNNSSGYLNQPAQLKKRTVYDERGFKTVTFE